MDLARLTKVVGVIARYGFGAFIAESSAPGLVKSGGDREALRRPASERFRMMLEELGPIFIKFGQLLSTRPDILPPDFIESLSGLQESVSPLSWAEIKGELDRGLPASVPEIFERVDEEPIATASVSQVHRARLRSGKEVVVKVRRPEIDKVVHADLDLLRALAKVLKGTIVEVSRHNPERWVDEFSAAVRKELDLMNEVRTIETFRTNGSQTGELVIPEAYAELSSSRVIVMEYLEGVPVTRVEDEEERRRVARVLLQEAYKQVFVDGFFHADPHPGNLRRLQGGRIGMLDFGLVGRLSARMRDLLVRLAMAVAFRDSERVAKIVYSAGIVRERVDLAALSRDVDDLFGTTLGRPLQEIDTELVVLRFMNVVSRYGITLPHELALLGKAGVNIEGVVRTLDPQIDIARELLPQAYRMLAVPEDPEALVTEGFKQLLRVKAMIEEVPLQIDQIVTDVAGGKMHVKVSSDQVEGLVPAIRELGALLAIGMVAAASIVAAALLIIPHFGEFALRGIPVLPVIAAAMAVYAGFLMAAVVAWALLRGRDLRIRMSRWASLFLRRKPAGR
jgi:ubiquinone biosynthesis protein